MIPSTLQKSALILLLATAIPGFAQPLWTQAPTTPQAALLLDERLNEDQLYIRARLIDVDTTQLYSFHPNHSVAAPDPTLNLPLFDAFQLTAHITQVETLAVERFFLYGEIHGHPAASLLFSIDGPILRGLLRAPGLGLFEILWDDTLGHVLLEIDSEFAVVCNTDHPPPTFHPQASPKGISTPGPIVDLMVVYTPGARQAAGGRSAIEDRILCAVRAANQAYQNSLIHHRLNLVHMQEVNYTEVDRRTALNHLTDPNDGQLDNVHALRDQHGADVVSLFIDRGNGGVGWQMASLSPSFEREAFNVVDQSVAASFLVLAHEVGHNMGAAHERNDPLNGLFSYSHAHITDEFRTVMASIANSATIPHFSNPAVESPTGGLTGIPETQPNAANNALTLNQSANLVSQFRVRNFDVNPINAQVLAAGSNVTFTVSYRGSGIVQWQANIISGASWLSFPTSNSGANNGSFTIRAAPNDTGIARTGTVRLETTGALETTINLTVTQPRCDTPPPPQNVSASDGQIPGAVDITWNQSPTATEYRVYRSDTQSGGFLPIGPWQTQIAFRDSTAPPPVEVTRGCNPGPQPAVRFYAVRARNNCGQGGLSTPNAGHAAAIPATNAENAAAFIPFLLILPLILRRKPRPTQTINQPGTTP